MIKLGILASITTIVVSLGFATMTAEGAAPCVTTNFKTQLVKNACAKGGQAAAKAAMKKFMKEAKLKSCNACHSKLAPKYDLKKDGFQQFKKLGGK